MKKRAKKILICSSIGAVIFYFCGQIEYAIYGSTHMHALTAVLVAVIVSYWYDNK